MKKYLQKNLNKDVKEMISIQHQKQGKQKQSINRQLLSLLSENKIHVQKTNTGIIHIPLLHHDRKRKALHQLSSKKINLSTHKDNKENHSLSIQHEGIANNFAVESTFQSLQKLKEEIFFSFGARDNAIQQNGPLKTHAKQIQSSETTISHIHQDRSPIKKQSSSHSRLRTIHSIKPSPQITPQRRQINKASTPCRPLKDKSSLQSNQRRKFIEVVSVTPSKIKHFIGQA